MRVQQIDGDEYESLASESRQAIVYHSLDFLRTLQEVLRDSELVLLGAYEGVQLVGALPLFLKRTELGNVLNSLPFYGSPGGCLLSPKVEGSSSEVREARTSLLRSMLDLAAAEGCATSTVISSPLDGADRSYPDLLHPDFTMDRVAQVLQLPKKEEDVMPRFSKKCRNSIRLAKKLGVQVSWDTTAASMDDLYEGQKRIMTEVGARPKPKQFFDRLIENMKGDGHRFRIYKATHADQTVALLLTLYYNGIVEYFVPVVPPESRRYAPMNVIVESVAVDAVKNGYRLLNFGGTRPGQQTLHRFKRSFGAEDMPYRYFTKAHRDLSGLREQGEDRLASAFEWFFVFPFGGTPTSAKGSL